MNSRSFRNEHPPEEGGGGGGGTTRPVGNLPLSRQTSIYALTFDELQSTMGGVGKDFGSMNMDELLKNIWSAEENQNQQTAASFGGGQLGGGVPGGYLQRQGSLTLPRTLSQKTVDEVWKNISGDDPGRKGVAAPDLQQQQRQPTLGEMTLEEFLFRAGVVREDMNLPEMDLPGRPNNNMNPLGVGFQPIDQGSGLMGNEIPAASNQFSMQPLNLPLNVQQQQQQLFPQQRTTAYTSSVALPTSAQLSSQGISAAIGGLADPSINANLVHSMGFQSGGMGMVSFGAGAATVAAGSPVNQLSSDGMGRSNGDTSSVSPVPLTLHGGLRGRKRSGAVEKVVERRQRRMIKNRESAARSRARKQAYTMELEAEVTKLKEENAELRKKQAELMEMQKNQVMEMMDKQQGGKRRRLRRTQTGPW